MSATLPSNFRVVYGRPKFSDRSDAWMRVAKCRHTPPELEAMANACDARVWRGLDGNLAVLAVSPALEAR